MMVTVNGDNGGLINNLGFDFAVLNDVAKKYFLVVSNSFGCF